MGQVTVIQHRQFTAPAAVEWAQSYLLKNGHDMPRSPIRHIGWWDNGRFHLFSVRFQ
jgi:hypothetical protein